MVAVYLCEFCLGPAKWTFVGEEVYFHCENQCDGFMQMELFVEPGVPLVTRGDDTGAPSINTGPPVGEGLPF